MEMQQIFKIIFISLLVAVLGLHCHMGFSLWVSLVVEHSPRRPGFSGWQHVGLAAASAGLWSTDSVVVLRTFSCSVACGIFLTQESNPQLLH